MPGLDPLRSPRDFRGVEPSAIKVVGQLRKSPWQRFARLQRSAARLASGPNVFREKVNTNRPAPGDATRAACRTGRTA